MKSLNARLILMVPSPTEKRFKKDALDYHEMEPRGKITVEPTKPHSTAKELSLAYSPGVAYPCLEIEKNPEDVYPVEFTEPEPEVIIKEVIKEVIVEKVVEKVVTVEVPAKGWFTKLFGR